MPCPAAGCLHLSSRRTGLPHPAPYPPLSPLPQVGFKKTLLQEVKAFVLDAVSFRQDWEANGPTVPGLDPMDATDRLRKFQQLFEVGPAWVGGMYGWRAGGTAEL